MVRNVVLIDDDAAVLESLEAVFTSAGYQVRAFGLAADFLAELYGLSPSCIVTDLRMPEIDGLRLLALLRGELGVNWPVVVISGHADAREAFAARHAGAIDFLIKPFAPQKLLAIVNACLHEHFGASARTARVT